MALEVRPAIVGERMAALESRLTETGPDVALLLAFDRPERVRDRPALARTYFEQRCATDQELTRIIEAFREIGAYVELFEGELPFLQALASGRLAKLPQPLKIVYNEIEGGITDGGFEPGRKALIPAVADAYGIICANSHAYGCAIGRHKFHYSRLLAELGVRTPATWHFRPGRAWAGGQRPPNGCKVIVKSTYENWSVGVTEASVFTVDHHADGKVAAVSSEIGQPVTVQEFISGREVGVTVFSVPELLIPPPVATSLAKAPGDPDAITTIHDNLDDRGVTLEEYAGAREVFNELYAHAARAFDILELGSFARFDFRVDGGGRTWLTDVGVSPGISTTDAAFLSMARLGFDHPSFIRAVIAANLAARGLLG